MEKRPNDTNLFPKYITPKVLEIYRYYPDEGYIEYWSNEKDEIINYDNQVFNNNSVSVLRKTATTFNINSF